MKTIAILGGGSAGFTAARTAAKQGARVLFFMGDHADHASLCINAGCMPSKAIFQPIDVMHHAKGQRWLEVRPRQPDQCLAEIIAWKDAEIAKFRAYRNQEIRELESKQFEIIRAPARLVSEHELVSRKKHYQFDAAIIATGSVTSLPRIAGLDPSSEGVWTSDEILQNTRVPKSLAIIGAGAVGLEFSLRYARLGSEVTIITRSSILPDFPPQFGDRLTTIYEREGIRVLTHCHPDRVTRNSEGEFAIEIEGGEKLKAILAEKLLLATGRRPAVDDLGLGAAGVELNRQGQLEIGEDMRVKGKDHLFAAGDVAGLRMVVHHAHIEAGIAAENACGDGHRQWTKRSNLEVIFSDPEFAFAGCTPAEAEKDGHQLLSATAESKDIGKLHLAGDDLGFGEFWVDLKTARLLSAGLLCDDAANLIHLPAYAIDHEHTIHQLEDAEYYHPTKIEIVAEIGDALCRKLGGRPFARAKE
jgi:mercuric reductase